VLTELKAFFEDGNLAKLAAASIRDGRQIALKVGSAEYTFTRERGSNLLREGAAPHPDFTFVIPEASARELVTRSFETVGQVGLHIFEKILSNDPDQKIRVKLEVGLLSVVTGGYLGVLGSGGADVAKFLATRGLGNLGKLKDAIAKMRGGE
jgi:hypothetical protein